MVEEGNMINIRSEEEAAEFGQQAYKSMIANTEKTSRTGSCECCDVYKIDGIEYRSQSVISDELYFSTLLHSVGVKKTYRAITLFFPVDVSIPGSSPFRAVGYRIDPGTGELQNIWCVSNHGWTVKFSDDPSKL